MRHMNYDKFKKEYEAFEKWNSEIPVWETKDGIPTINSRADMVNSPAHYTRGSQEVIEIIEDVIRDAPEVAEGYLQGQALKYLLRLWLKDNPKQDAEKAVWYLNRLIQRLEVTG